MIELLLTGTLLVILVGISLRVVITKTNNGYFTEALSVAEAIANRADLQAHRVSGSSQNASGIYQYTWLGSATWTGVSALNTGGTAPMPLTTPYGTPYEWMATGTSPGMARFLVPTGYKAALQRTGVVLTPVAGGIEVTVTTLRYPNKSPYNVPSTARAQLYLEETR